MTQILDNNLLHPKKNTPVTMYAWWAPTTPHLSRIKQLQVYTRKIHKSDFKITISSPLPILAFKQPHNPAELNIRSKLPADLQTTHELQLCLNNRCKTSQHAFTAIGIHTLSVMNPLESYMYIPKRGIISSRAPVALMETIWVKKID